jgi:hypothetical protein
MAFSVVVVLLLLLLSEYATVGLSTSYVLNAQLPADCRMLGGYARASCERAIFVIWRGSGMACPACSLID